MSYENLEHLKPCAGCGSHSLWLDGDRWQCESCNPVSSSDPTQEKLKYLGQSTVVVLGCFHEIQYVDQTIMNRPPYQAEHVEYRTLLKRILERHQIGLIGEEAKATERTVAQEFADASNIQHWHIDIPLELQDQIHHRKPNDFVNGECVDYIAMKEKYAVAWAYVREFHMIECFKRHIPWNTPALIICGIFHADAIAAMLKEDGYPVRQYSVAVPNEDK